MPEILDIPKISTPIDIEPRFSYLDWSAIIAGALVGVAIIATLTAFGSSVGLSLTSPYLGRGLNGYATAVAIAIWTMWVIISGFIAAGYIAGRIRHTTREASIEEGEIRNGAHGLAAWAITTLAVTLLAGSAILGSESVLKRSNEDYSSRSADQLLRSGEPTGQSYNEGLHREVAAILRSASYTGKVTPADKSYLVSLAGRNAQSDAEPRVDAAIADAKERTDTARKLAVLVGFLTAASLAVGAAAAWWAAKLGGLHRLDYRGISVFTRWS